MKHPGFWHMVFASLVSAFSYTPLGRSKAKEYLTTQKDAVLASEAMCKAYRRSITYHNLKNWWPTFLEESEHQEMPSKYMCFCAVIAGMLVILVPLTVAGIVIGAVG